MEGRPLAKVAAEALIAAVVVPAAMVAFGQLSDPTSWARLRLAELREALHERWIARTVNRFIEEA